MEALRARGGGRARPGVVGGRCDVRRALSHPSNKRLAAHAASAPGGVRLWLFSFVVHETLAAASVGGLAFYAGLAAAAPGPALFAFADVRRASAAAGQAAVWAAMAAACPGGLARAEPLDPAALPAATLVLYKHG